ncbi:MAG: alpha/beta fold hydrolase [Acidimicrobiales bacterium]
MSRSRVAVVAGMAGALGVGYAVERAGVRRWRVDGEALAASGRTLPADLRHHFVPMSDGGRLHAVELGVGPPVVLVPGISLTLATWAPQLRQLSGRRRVIAVSLRGHGQSVAGDGGYGLERMADDLLELLGALDLDDAVLCGHSMGGMVSQLLAVRHPAEMRHHVARLVLAATSPGPVAYGPFVAALQVGASGALRRAERRGAGLFPGNDLGVWITRFGLGSRPKPADIELTRSMIDAMSPAALGAMVQPLLGFDVRDRLGAVDLPTRVVVGTRDLLTPPRTARAIVARLHGAGLTVLPGCGHMMMLERADELCDLLT